MPSIVATKCCPRQPEPYGAGSSRVSSVSASIPPHPLRVKPSGNGFLADGPNARVCTGTWQALPDEVLVTVLEYLDDTELLLLGSTCTFLYAFCHLDELWKAVFLEWPQDRSQSLAWLGSWRRTVLALSADQEASVDCGNVFSDVLHRPFVCTNIDLTLFATIIPKANQIRRFENLSADEFSQLWTEKPFILTKCIGDWPVCSSWTIDSLVRDYSAVEFRAEAVDWTFVRYHSYLEDNNDESPLYFFDSKFAEKMGVKIGEGQSDAAYWRPDCFGPDLFEVLGEERPAHRWLIVGPKRSGSSFHKDPNGTSAWNAVIQGAKYWIMFPPTACVPGVYVSNDSSQVTSPLSIAEWLLTFHQEARQLAGCVEGVCHAKEILYVPSGWWHLVVNLESGVALTQNFVALSSSANLLAEVLSFLRHKPDQVSGFSKTVDDPYSLFTERLRRTYSDALEKALALVDRKSGKKRRWDETIGRQEEKRGGEVGGFSFAFGGDIDEEIS